jgi:hypothetical protein
MDFDDIWYWIAKRNGKFVRGKILVQYNPYYT